MNEAWILVVLAFSNLCLALAYYRHLVTLHRRSDDKATEDA